MLFRSVMSAENLVVKDGALLSNAGSLVLKKGLTNEYTVPFAIGTGTAEFSGVANQSILGHNIIQNLTVNNSTGVTIGGNTNVNGILGLTSGAVTLGSNNLLLGPSATILCDMHWKHTAAEAIRLIQEMQHWNLAVAEAPCHPEDIEGQALVARGVAVPVGLGEELRTVFEFLPRFERRCMGVIQPEMGRTGVTAFMEICTLARAFHVAVMPHASIGIGLFQAASLHASAVLPHLQMHEYQHSIFDKNLKYIVGDMRCAEGRFFLPTGPGLGVVPSEQLLEQCQI